MTATTRGPLLGDPDYDADMVVVEDFVAQKWATLDDSNFELKQKVVHNYYITGLYRQWVKVREYLDKNKHSRYSEDSNSYILKRIKYIESRFKRHGQIDIITIGNLFYYMAQVSCLNPKPQSGRGWESEEDQINYPVANGIGYYGINTYLYAFFEKILLVGIPVGDSNWDFTSGCAAEFIDHDIEHSHDLYWILKPINADHLELGKRFYYFIHGNDEITLPEKRCHIIFLFFFYHEFANMDLTFYTLANTVRDVDRLLELTRLFGSPFIEEFRSLRAITYNTSSIIALADLLTEALDEEDDENYTEYLSIEIRDCVAGLIDLPLDEIDSYYRGLSAISEDVPTDAYMDTLLAFWYHIQTFVNFYSPI